MGTNQTILRMQHTSLQFSDGPKQQEADVAKIFRRGRGQGFPIKTGTESGPETATHELLKHYAKKHNHRIHFARGNWIAVDRAIIQPKSVLVGSLFVEDTKNVVGPGHDSVAATMTFRHIRSGVGRIGIAAAHYPTKGRRPGDPNYQVNIRYAKRINNWMRTLHRRGTLPFVSGDFNMPDQELDWDFGLGFTSLGDHLQKWPGTGHGPIDGMACYDESKRVMPRSLNVLNDKEMFMHSDHFVYRGAWIVKHKS